MLFEEDFLILIIYNISKSLFFQQNGDIKEILEMNKWIQDELRRI